MATKEAVRPPLGVATPQNSPQVAHETDDNGVRPTSGSPAAQGEPIRLQPVRKNWGSAIQCMARIENMMKDLDTKAKRQVTSWFAEEYIHQPPT